jgi:hypothetical protein
MASKIGEFSQRREKAGAAIVWIAILGYAAVCGILLAMQ